MAGPQTEFLSLPLSVGGVQRHRQSYVDAMQLIDAWAANGGGGGGGGAASGITYIPPAGFSATNVQTFGDELAAYTVAVEGRMGTAEADIAALEAVSDSSWAKVIPTGVAATDTAALIAARNGLKPIELVQNGLPLRLNAAVAFTDRDVRIKGNGVVVEQTVNALALDIRCTLETPMTVTQIAVEDRNLNGISAATSKVTRVRVALGAGGIDDVVLGDIYKLGSDDKAPAGSIGENPRMGEACIVMDKDVSTGDLWFPIELWESAVYATNIRLSRMRGQDFNISVMDVKFYIPANLVSGGGFNGPIWLEGTVFAHIEVHVIQAGSFGVFTLGNFALQLQLRVDRIIYDTAVGQLGYGCLSSADAYMQISLLAQNCRHSWTTNWSNGEAAGTTDIRHGPVLAARVTGHAMFCHGACVDTHSDAVGCVIYGMELVGSFNGQTAIAAGFQIRGEDNSVLSCNVYNCGYVAQLFENTVDGSRRNLVANVRGEGKLGGIFVNGWTTSTRKPTFEIRDSVFRFGGNFFCQLKQAELTLENVHLIPVGTVNGTLILSNGISQAGNGWCRGRVTVSLDQTTGAWTLHDLGGTGNKIQVEVTNRDFSFAAPDADLTVRDTHPDVIDFLNPVVAPRTVTHSPQGRGRKFYRRLAGATGASAISIGYTGGTATLDAVGDGVIIESVDGFHRLVYEGAIQ